MAQQTNNLSLFLWIIFDILYHKYFLHNLNILSVRRSFNLELLKIIYGHTELILQHGLVVATLLRFAAYLIIVSN